MLVPSLGFMYKGFFKDDRPWQYGQVVSIKHLAGFFNLDFPDVTSAIAQKFIEQYNFKNIFQMQVSEKVLSGKCCYNFIEERDCSQNEYLFPSNSASN